jgi:hypothetical protein
MSGAPCSLGFDVARKTSATASRRARISSSLATAAIQMVGRKAQRTNPRSCERCDLSPGISSKSE